jgi:hypothetical protein
MNEPRSTECIQDVLKSPVRQYVWLMLRNHPLRINACCQRRCSKPYGRSNGFGGLATLPSLPTSHRYAVIRTIRIILIRPLADRSRLYHASAFEPTEAEMETLQKSAQVAPLVGPDEEDDAALEPSALLKKEGKAKAEPELSDLSLKNLTIDEETVEPSTKMLKMVRNNTLSETTCFN